MRSVSKPYFFDNPFKVIGASSRDNKSKLVELAEEKSLSIDPELCAKARSDLSNPRTRIACEVSWFPGVSPKRCDELCRIPILNASLIDKIDTLPSLAMVNLYACIFQAIEGNELAEVISATISKFSHLIEKISFDEIVRDINEDRLVSSFPEIRSTDLIEEAYAGQLSVYKDLVKNALDRFDPESLVKILTLVVDLDTESGKHSAPMFTELLIDMYEVEVISVLDSELDKLKSLKYKILNKLDARNFDLSADIDTAIRVLSNFGKIAFPIILLNVSKGTKFNKAEDIADEMRSLGIALNNKYQQTEASIRVISSIKMVFNTIDDISEQANEDEEKLSEILHDQNQARIKSEKEKLALRYSGEIGIIFKEKVEINHEGIRYGSKYFQMDKITRIGWGSVKNSVNGIPTGTDYTIFFGDDHELATIQTRRKEVNDNVTDRLWKARAYEIMSIIIDRLKRGEAISFGDMTIWDDRVKLRRHKFFGSEDVVCYWKDTYVNSYNGEFFVVHKSDNKIYKSLPFKSTPNIFILNTLLDTLHKKASINRISQVFE
jgi:hypothetical protein